MNYKPYHQFTQKGYDSMWISVISCKIGVLECKRMYPLDHFCEISHYWSLCSWLLENLLSWSVCNLHYLTFLDYKLDEIPPPKKKSFLGRTKFLWTDLELCPWDTRSSPLSSLKFPNFPIPKSDILSMHYCYRHFSGLVKEVKEIYFVPLLFD